jgi:hypothetical protein
MGEANFAAFCVKLFGKAATPEILEFVTEESLAFDFGDENDRFIWLTLVLFC